MKDKKGFTLIELIVCIALLATLNIVIGYNIKTASKNSKSSRYKATMKEVFNAAYDFVDMSISTCNINSDEYCLITVEELVESSLLDKKIFDTKIPIYSDGRKFEKDTTLKVTKQNGEKTVTLECLFSMTYTITNKNLDDFAENDYWERCE